MSVGQYARYPVTGGSGGTVTTISVATANGFAGSVATPTTTPVITLTTTVTGLLKGNGTAISAQTTGDLTDAGTDGIVVTGGSGSVIGSGTSIAQHVADTTHNGYLNSTDWNTFNNKQSTLTLGNLTDVGTDGIVVTGGTGSVVGSGTSLAQHVSDTTHNGYLSSTDWNTFNGKQASGNYITALTSDVTAAGPGSVAATIANSAVTNAKMANMASSSSTVGTVKGNISGSAAAPSDLVLTSANTASSAVYRDASGNFSAGTITAALTGNATTATTATNATNVATTATSTNASFFPVFVASSSSGNQAADIDSGFSVNPSTHAVTATTFIGALTGTASGNTTISGQTNHGVVTSGSSTAMTSTGAGTSGQVLTSNGSSSDPTFKQANPLVSVTSQTTTYTALTTDYLILCSASAFTVTLPAASNSGKILVIKKTDSSLSNVITIARAGSDTIDGATSTTLSTQYEAVTLIADGTATWAVADRSVVSQWSTSLSFTPNGFGTVASTTYLSKRVGDSLKARITFTAGTAAAATGSITMPTGITIDSTKLPSSGVSMGGLVYTTSGSSQSLFPTINNVATVFYDGSTTDRVFITIKNDTASPFLKVNASTWCTNSEPLSVEFEVPVSGWK